MSLTLETLKSKKGSRRVSKRVGRGLSKGGTYSGRGSKGQRSRSGGKSGLKLKGLRKIMLRLPKSRGFRSLNPNMETINVGTLASSFGDGAKVSPHILFKKGLVKSVRHGVKVLGEGKIGIALTLSGLTVSEGAKAKIEKAGGSILK